MKVSSSNINQLIQSCPKGLAASRDGSMKGCERVFAHGVANHAVLEAASRGEIDTFKAMEIARKLSTEIRRFRGIDQLPLPVDRVLVGIEMALKYLDSNPVPTGQAEKQYSGKAGEHEIEAIIDLVYHEEQDFGDVVMDASVVRDYKSAWNTGPDDLNTIQRKMQQVVVLQSGEYDSVIPEVINLRTGATYRGEIITKDSEEYILYLKEIEVAAATVQAAINNPVAVPSENCGDCRFQEACPDAIRSTHDMVVDYLLAKKTVSKLESELKKMTSEEPLHNGRYTIGHEPATRATPIEGIEKLIASEFAEFGADAMLYIENALAQLNIGAGNIRAFAKNTKFERKDKKDFLESALDQKKTSKFCVSIKK